MTTTNDGFTDIERELEEASDQARRLLDSTDGRLFTVRPNPESWSAAECIGHLTLTSQSFLPILKDAIADGRRRNLTSPKKPKMDLIGRVLRWFLEPPIRSRVKTAAPFVPRAIRSKADALAEFTAMQSQLVDLLRTADGLDLTKVKIASPFDKRVRYNLYSAFRILAAHERRHLWQAEKAVETLRHH